MTDTPLPLTDEQIIARFATAAGGAPPTEIQRASVAELRDHALGLALEINERCPEGRHKSLALTAVEEALMWANKSLFTEGVR